MEVKVDHVSRGSRAMREIADLEEIAFGPNPDDYWSPARIAREHRTSGNQVIAADNGQLVVGYAILRRPLGQTSIEIVRIAVDPDHRRKGVGSQMITHVRAILAKTGHYTTEAPESACIWTVVRESDADTRDFLVSQGFWATGLVRDRFPGHGEFGEDGYRMEIRH